MSAIDNLWTVDRQELVLTCEATRPDLHALSRWVWLNRRSASGLIAWAFVNAGSEESSSAKQGA